MGLRGKDTLRKKRRQLWLEREKDNEWSQNSQPMHDGKSPGPLTIHLVLCNRKRACAVSAICDEWQRGTHVGGKTMQQTTSATNRLQPQHTYNIGHARPITHLYPHTHTIVHTHMVGLWGRDWMTTVMTNTPWFDGNHSLHQHHCGAQHPHPTHHSCRLLGGALAIPMPLCAPLVAWKAWCCACHVLPFHSFHSCPPLCPSLTHSVPLALTLCQTYSPVND